MGWLYSVNCSNWNPRWQDARSHKYKMRNTKKTITGDSWFPPTGWLLCPKSAWPGQNGQSWSSMSGSLLLCRCLIFKQGVLFWNFPKVLKSRWAWTSVCMCPATRRIGPQPTFSLMTILTWSWWAVNMFVKQLDAKLWMAFLMKHCCQSLFQTWSEVVKDQSLVDPGPVVELLANISTLQPEKRWQRYRTQVSDYCLSNFFYWSS